MERHRRVRRSTLATALGAALAVSVFAPPFAGGDVVGDVLNTVGVGGGSADNRAGVPPNYQPPLHGTNPHGQGTVATVDLNPSNSNPYPGSPPSGQEEIVIGSSRGEQNGDNYHGRVTLAYVNLSSLIPLGPIDIFIESNEGQTNTGPTGPINTALGNLCAASTGAGGPVCLNVLAMNSSSNNTGSSNSFTAVSANIGPLGAGGPSLSAQGPSSSGNIQENGGCQTASGSSTVARAALVVPGIPLGQPTADVLSSTSSSTACNNGFQSSTNDSNTLTLVGQGIPVPAAGCPGPNEVANTVFGLPLGLGSIVCNANDINNGQTSNPYGVREALAPFVTLPILPVIRAAVSGTESHAVAPDANNPAGGNKKGDGGGKGVKGGSAEGDAGSVAGDAAAGDGSLAFTGANLIALLLIGAGLIGLGLLAMAARERQTV